MTAKKNTAPKEEPRNYQNFFLWGCLAAFILFFVGLCCLVTIIFGSFFADFDPLGFDLRNRIEQYLLWPDFLDEPSVVPELPDILDETPAPLIEVTPDEMSPTVPAPEASCEEFSTYVAHDFQAIFDFPAGWDVEPEEYGVTFYDTDSPTALRVGEAFSEAGTTARQIAEDLMASFNTESEQGSLVVFEETPFTVPTGDDAYLAAYEFIDSDGDYQWFLDLETISGESNVYFYLSGDNLEDYQFYRELIEVIAASYSK
jgi:hypothetical protein